MKILLTGGAGFIGGNLVKRLVKEGHDVIVFDSMTPAKVKNIAGENIYDYNDKDSLLRIVSHESYLKSYDAIVHLGATSSTTCVDKSIIYNNYHISRDLIGFAIESGIPIIYASSASVYGNTQSPDSFGFVKPLNMYGLSKAFTDSIVMKALKQDVSGVLPMIVGLRFFNVMGPGESHKGSQASVIYNWHKQFQEKGGWDVFEGDNQRDFVHVDDIVNCIHWFVKNIDSKKSGIYDVGTGEASDFKDIHDIMNFCLRPKMPTRIISIPDALTGQYQIYTRADLAPLRAIGYDQPFTNLDEGVSSYVDFLNKEKNNV